MKKLWKKVKDYIAEKLPAYIYKFLFFSSVILAVIFIITTVVIYLDKTPEWTWNSEGIKGLFEIYFYPVRILVALLAVLTLLVATRRSIVADIQIVEMERQREASYLPDLIIKRSIYYVNTNVSDKNYSNLKLRNSSPESGVEPKIYIQNVGRGVAKEFKYTFHYAYLDCFLEILHHNDDTYFDFDYKSEPHHLKVRTKSEEHYFINQTYDLVDSPNYNVEYILPTDKSDIPVEISLPTLYLKLRFIQDELLLKKSNLKGYAPSGIDNLPKLYIVCEYKDIGQVERTKKFNLDIQAFLHSEVLNSDLKFNKKSLRYDVVPIELKI